MDEIITLFLNFYESQNYTKKLDVNNKIKYTNKSEAKQFTQ